MLEFEELKLRLVALEPQIEDLKDALGLEQCKAEVRRLEAQQEDPNFWNDVETSTKVQRKLSQLNGKINSHKDLETRYEDTMTLIEIALADNDPSPYDVAFSEVETLEKDIDEL